MNPKSRTNYTIVVFTISIILAIVASVAVCKLAFDAVTLWVVISVAAVSVLVAGFGAGTMLEGIIITIIVGIIAAFAILVLNISPFLNQILLSASIGICIGSFVLGTYYEFFSPS